MSDKKKKKSKAETPSNKLTKEGDAIARFVRFNCPTNTTMFEGNEVHYFSAKKAVDCLVESKKYGVNAKTPKFANIEAAELFLAGLLEKGFFFRARKVVLKKKDKPEKKKEIDIKLNKSPKSPKPTKKAVTKDAGDVSEGNAGEGAELLAADEESGAETKPQQEEEKKKKKKVKLIFHNVQVFDYDPADVYVWIFDPTPFFKKFIGFLIVLGTIAGCLFPLWPDWLRLVIYYLSVTGIALFGLLLGVALLRTIFFGIIWACTLGRHKLWLLPNLMEDCGFFESFKPVYTYEYIPGSIFGQPKKGKKKRSDGNGSRKASKSADPKSEDSEAPSAVSSEHNTPKVERDSKSKRLTKDEETVNKSEIEENERRTAEKSGDDQPAIDLADKDSETEETVNDGDQETIGADETELRKRNVGHARASSPADEDFVIVDQGSTA